MQNQKSLFFFISISVSILQILLITTELYQTTSGTYFEIQLGFQQISNCILDLTFPALNMLVRSNPDLQLYSCVVVQLTIRDTNYEHLCFILEKRF